VEILAYFNLIVRSSLSRRCATTTTFFTRLNHSQHSTYKMSDTTAAPNSAAEARPLSGEASTGAADAAAAAAPAATGTGTGTEPPTKSALKRMEKEAALAAKKALKKAASVANPANKSDGAAKKKEVKKPAAVVEEPAFIEVPEGHIKGEGHHGRRLQSLPQGVLTRRNSRPFHRPLEPNGSRLQSCQRRKVMVLVVERLQVLCPRFAFDQPIRVLVL
jgi:hypothetical protein